MPCGTAMDEKLIRQLKECGVDYEGTMSRFLNNEGMFCKFLKKFLDDTNYVQLLETVVNKDYEIAFRCAHTLKGVTANLGLESVRVYASEITELLRDKAQNEVDEQKLKENIELLKEKYTEVCAVIRNMD